MNTLITGKEITAGMNILIADKVYCVESVDQIELSDGHLIVQTKLIELSSGKTLEKSFKLNQEVKHIVVEDSSLEFLYFEESKYLFLDVDTLELVSVASEVVGNSADYLKEGIAVKARSFGSEIIGITLPPFLELMVSAIEDEDEVVIADVNNTAVLETGAKVEIPSFVTVGDVVKVDTSTGEYIQRV